ncbi:predicted protein [Streptomyces albidoflavus]|nr:predicted protein [Streptomyces albidoflavus]BDH50088.1 hypothetical protein MTP02_10990 [Streptomyces albus]
MRPWVVRRALFPRGPITATVPAPGVGERRPAVPIRFPTEESPCRIPPQTSPGPKATPSTPRPN